MLLTPAAWIMVLYNVDFPARSTLRADQDQTLSLANDDQRTLPSCRSPDRAPHSAQQLSFYGAIGREKSKLIFRRGIRVSAVGTFPKPPLFCSPSAAPQLLLSKHMFQLSYRVRNSIVPIQNAYSWQTWHWLHLCRSFAHEYTI